MRFAFNPRRVVRQTRSNQGQTGTGALNALLRSDRCAGGVSSSAEPFVYVSPRRMPCGHAHLALAMWHTHARACSREIQNLPRYPTAYPYDRQTHTHVRPLTGGRQNFAFLLSVASKRSVAFAFSVFFFPFFWQA